MGAVAGKSVGCLGQVAPKLADCLGGMAGKMAGRLGRVARKLAGCLGWGGLEAGQLGSWSAAWERWMGGSPLAAWGASLEAGWLFGKSSGALPKTVQAGNSKRFIW